MDTVSSFPSQDNPQKRCTGCERLLSLSQYSNRKRSRDGLASRCRECRNAERKAYHQKHKERDNATNRAYYQKHRESVSLQNKEYYEQHKEQYSHSARLRYQQNIERHKARNKAWHEANRERHNQLTLSYYFQNKEVWDKRNRQWYKEHPEAVAAAHSKRRALKRKNGGSFTSTEWQEMKSFYDYTCLRCLRREPDIELTADHVLPLASGGTSYIENIQPLCRSCNSWKSNRYIDYRGGVS